MSQLKSLNAVGERPLGDLAAVVGAAHVILPGADQSPTSSTGAVVTVARPAP
jgi:hypothetical protein